MSPFEVYKTYLALKQHFTKPGYSYQKYNGKVNAKASSFESRRDRFYFEKLAKLRDPTGFLLANLVENPKVWVGELVAGDESDRVYSNWLKRNQALKYQFGEDLSRLEPDFDSNFSTSEGHPLLLRHYLAKRVSLETLIILVHMTKCFSRWNKALEYDPVWKEVSLKITKYQPFMKYEIDNFRKIVVDKFS